MNHEQEPVPPPKNPRARYLYNAATFRTTYTVQNTAKYLVFFRAAVLRVSNPDIKNPDTFIRGDLIGGMSPRTWVQKANDALLFLCNESLKDWEELNPRTIESNDFWIRFRLSIKFKPVIEPDLGLWIIFKNTLFANAIRNGSINSQATVTKPSANILTNEQLAEEIIKDNTASQSPAEVKKEQIINTRRADWEERVIQFIEGADKMLIINNLSLTLQEVTWIEDRIRGLQIDKVVRADTIRLIRG